MASVKHDSYTQPYAAAVLERMERLEMEKENEDEDSDDPDDYDYDHEEIKRTAREKGHPQRLEQSVRILSLALINNEIVCRSVSGSELVRVPCPQLPVVAGGIKALLTEALRVTPEVLTLLQENFPIGDDKDIEQVDSLVVKLIKEDLTIFVCEERKNVFFEPALGEACVSLNFPDSVSLQCLQEHREFATQSAGMCWLVYSKSEVSMAACGANDPLVPIGIFCAPPAWPLPPMSLQCGGAGCDVWSVVVDLPVVRPLLEAHAAATNDRPIPRYQMIIDPNQFVRDGPGGAVWVPCEFDVKADGSACLVGGRRSHIYPHLAKDVATPVLEAALPLLARLQRPRLLLDQRRLQVVLKAQRIIVPAKSSDGADAEYVGLWHVDGYNENVVAVVLYYYNVHPALNGGDMEFCGREPLDVLGIGDCDNNYYKLKSPAIRGALQRCRAPIKNGTLLVFSNYQMVHRVLRMVNTSSDTEASRDFVALFIIDPAAKPLVPARCHLARSDMIGRTLSGIDSWNTPMIGHILEFMGEVPSLRYRRERRAELLLEQLKPSGEFIGISSVHSTGNGCFTMIGWLHKMLKGDQDGKFMLDEAKSDWQRFRAQNTSPQKVDRGLSEALSVSSSQLQHRLDLEEQTNILAATQDAALLGPLE